MGISPLERGIIEGENPVFGPLFSPMWYVFQESVCLGMQTKMGGKYHLKLNIGERPIANKYREGKMKRTLKRELNSTWNCQKGNAWNQYCWQIISLAFLHGALVCWQVNISLVWGKKPEEGSPRFTLGVIASGPALDWTEDCSVFWVPSRLLKPFGRQHADCWMT